MVLIRNWWILIVRGLTSVVFGLYFFFYPDLTLVLLGRGFFFYSAFDGILCLLMAFLTHQSKLWRRIFLGMGLLSIAAAGLALYQPLIASVLAFTTIAPAIIFVATLEIIGGQLLKKELARTGWLTAGGVISLVLGLLLVIQPLVGFSSIENLLGVVQIVRGISNVILAFELKLNREKVEEILNSEI